MATTLLTEHGHPDLPVTFGRARRALGQVIFRRGEAHEIRLSTPLLQHLTRDELTDVILHEIAHVKAGIRAGHGPAWKAHARRLGANPNRTAHLPESVERATAKYVATCTSCGANAYFHRKLKHPIENYQHVTCGGSFANLEQLR